LFPHNSIEVKLEQDYNMEQNGVGVRKKKFIEAYTVEEVAKALKLHPYPIRRLYREGKIPAFKFGGRWRFDKQELDNLRKRKNEKGI